MVILDFIFSNLIPSTLFPRENVLASIIHFQESGYWNLHLSFSFGDLAFRYQKSNNGNFPSLNLTHKEVGGSFYTVREIVRDIIQENRVLGPAKLIGDEKSSNPWEEYPLGSIATAPQYPLTVLSNNSQLVTDQHQGCHEEPNLVPDVHHSAIEDQVFDNGQVISVTQVRVNEEGLNEPNDAEIQGRELVELEQNGDDKSNKEADLVSDGNYAFPGREMVDKEHVINDSQVDLKNKESHELPLTELDVSDPSKAENVEEDLIASRSKVTPIAANVIVETFPLRPLTTTGDLDGRWNELTERANTFNEQHIKKVELAADIGNSRTDGIDSFKNSSLIDEKEDTKLSHPLLDKNSGLVDEEVREKHGEPLLESSKSSNEGAVHEIQDSKDNNIKLSSNNVTSATLKNSQEGSGAKVSFVQACFLSSFTLFNNFDSKIHENSFK